MMAERNAGRARTWTRSIMLGSVAVVLSICSWSPSPGQERRGTCEEQGETLAIYDCQTGLVLWSRRQSGQTPPMVPSDRELCRLVVGPTKAQEGTGQCF